MNITKHIKSILGIMAIALIALILVGCGGNKEAQAFADKLYIADSDDIRGSFPLPKFVQGNRDAIVTWVSENDVIVTIDEYPEWDTQFSSELYYKATVVLPTTKTNVDLVATVTFGSQTATRKMTISVQADEYIASTVVQAKAASLNTKVRIQGSVIYVAPFGYAVQDSTCNMYVYGSNHGRQLGDIVVVRGNRAVYNGMPQLGSATSEKIDQEPASFNPLANAIVGTVGDIMALPVDDGNSYTKMYKLQVMVEQSSDVHNPYHLTNPYNLEEFVGVTRYTSENSLAELNTLKGKFVECYVLVYSSYAGAYSVVFVENKAVEKSLSYTDQNKADLALQRLQLDLDGTIVTSDMDFFAELAAYDAEITWTSSNLDLIAADGKVTFPDEDTKVTITIDTKVNDATASGTIEVTVSKLDVSPISTLIPLTPEAASAPKVLVLIEGKVIGHQYRGYWVADETGAVLVWVGANLTETNAPAVGSVVQVKGELTTFGETNSFVTQIAPLVFTVIEDAPAVNVIEPVVKTFDELFAYGLTTRAEAQDAAEELYGKFITITGQLVRMGSDNFWKIQDPTNADRWFRLNNLADNSALLALRNDATPPTVTITVMVRDLYFINDTSAYNNYKAGTIGGIYFAGEGVVVPAT